MSNRSAVVAAIVSWLARGASPVDGMYSFEVARDSRRESAEARRPAPVPSNVPGVCCT